MEQPQPRKTAGAPLDGPFSIPCLGGALLSTLLALAGCWKPTQRAVIAVPAARQQALGRQLQLLPPFELVSQRDSVVRIVTDDVTCTGTLIAEDRVLTAHHCVSARDAHGHVLTHNKDPEEIQIELGGDYLPWGEVKVRAIVTPECGYASGDGDIAILVLARHLIGMPISTARIEAPPEKKDMVSVFGFGRCSLSPDAIHLRFRDAGQVCTAPDKCRNEGIQEVFPGHFRMPASICPGDSGGPVYSSRGDLIGVISASVMDGDEHTQDTSLFTRLDIWTQLFAAAHEISLGASPSELPPFGDCRAAAARGASAKPR